MDAQDGNVERAAAEVVDEDGLVLLGVEAVTDGGRGGLVDEREHLQAGGAGAQLGGVPGQALRVGGDGHDRLVEILVQLLLGIELELGEQHGGDLLGAQVLADEWHAFAECRGCA